MSQHDYNIANGGGAAVRADINTALLAILSQNSGATAPTTTKPFMFWYDTTTGVLKMRNAADTAWIAAIDGISNGNPTGLKNRILNGGMMIDQRNAGASVAGNNVYSLDRWLAVSDASNKWTFQQNSGSVTPPVGFKNYLGCVSSSAYSPSSTDYFGPQQRIEGFNVADLAWGTANASPITISFWVRSSLTGTFGGAVMNNAQDRNYPFSYTISSANTWEYKTVTIAGDTTGTWLTDNGAGLKLHFSLGAGSSRVGTANAWTGTANVFAPSGAVNVVATSGATFYITGVQLEKGSTATSFDYRPYGTELALCQRYYQKSFPQATAPAQGAGVAGAVYCQGQAANSPAYAYVPLKVTMRAAPSTVTLYNPISANANWRNTTAGTDINSNVGMANDSALYINANTQVLSTYQEGAIHYAASAEL